MQRYAVSFLLVSILAILSFTLPVTGQGPVSVTVSPGVGIQQGGTPQGVATTLNCSTNVTCTGSGSVFTITASSGSGGITQLTGDGTAGPGTGSQAFTLATVNSGPGACGDATHVCQITTNGKGLTTSQMQVAITGGGGSGGSGFTVYSGLAGIALTGTTFFPFGGGNPASTTESVVQVGIQAAATFANFGANLSVALGTTLGVNNSVVLTFRKNGSSQAITCTITNPATSCADTTHSFTTAVNDLIDVQAVFTGTISATPVFLMSVQVGAGSGGGGTVTATTFSSLPVTCTSGALYLFTNSAIGKALCGVANTYTYFIDGLGQVTPPVLANFTAVNSPTTNGTQGGVILTAPQSGSDNYRLLMQPIATAPYTTTGCVLSGNPAQQYLPIGIGLYDGTKLVVISIYLDTGAGSFGVKTVKFSNLTTFSAYYNTVAYNGGNGFTCLRIKDDGTNRIMSWSPDNVNYYLVTSVSDTDFLTPTQIGMTADSVNTTYGSTGWFVHFLTTQP